MATTEATYGPLNPDRAPDVERAFWDLSESASLLLLGVRPSITARKGYIGRAKVTSAFEKYFATSGHEHASDMTKGRYDITARHGISRKDMARFESVQGITILSNTIPSAFWIYFHVLSHPAVLNAVRQRVGAEHSDFKRWEDISRIIPVANLREDPIFASVVQESLRHQVFGAATRMVMQDTLLDDRFLLKKGTILMMPNEAIHKDTKIWGSSVSTFEPARFTRKAQAESEKLPNGAFRAFGGGANMCPGRFFATTKILFMLALISSRYDITPANGEWRAPRPDIANMSSIVTPPMDSDKVPVRVSRIETSKREETKWIFEL